MKWLYDLAVLLFAAAVLPKFLVRLSQSKRPGRMLRERFGFLGKEIEKKTSGKKVLWVHAVSVGEVMLLKRWAELFLEGHGDWTLAISTTTSTGREVAERLFEDRAVIFYSPIDLSWVVNRFFEALRPSLLLLVELELWPNLVTEAAKRLVPAGIVNGRMSARAFKRYSWIKPLAQRWFGRLRFCLAQSEEDRKRFIALGVPGERVEITGNMKFDQEARTAFAFDRRFEWIQNFLSGSFVWLAGSTSGGEEAFLLNVFRQLRAHASKLKLILAPRHPERVKAVLKMVRGAGFSPRLFSDARGSAEAPVLVVDQMGVLSPLYLFADVVFMGGSLIKKGGQNPIEAAVCRKPVLHGPHVFNFESAYKILDEEGGAFCVRSVREIRERMIALMNEPNRRKAAGERAFEAVQKMKGATVRTLEHLSKWLQPNPTELERVNP